MSEEDSNSIRAFWKEQVTLGSDVTPTIQALVSSMRSASAETFERDFKRRIYEAFNELPDNEIVHPLAKQIVLELRRDGFNQVNRQELTDAENLNAHALYPPESNEDNIEDEQPDESGQKNSNSPEGGDDNNEEPEQNNDEDNKSDVEGGIASDTDVVNVSTTSEYVDARKKRGKKRGKRDNTSPNSQSKKGRTNRQESKT